MSANNPKSFEDAKGLCVNLIDTVRADYAKMFSQPPPAQPQPQVPPNGSIANGLVSSSAPAGESFCPITPMASAGESFCSPSPVAQDAVEPHCQTMSSGERFTSHAL